MTPNQLKNSILQLAIQGKLVEQRPEEGTAEELYKQIQAEKAELIKQGKVKKEKPLTPISPDEIPFDLPKNWFWTRLGQILIIARGGSPRPIKDFLTESKDGINWIKIGDSDIGGKYINSTKEKIIPEGMKKSRFVHKGDFLLSNSMSFGRPYILNIDGCIHDGWLVLHPLKEIFDKDFLYYLLSSPMIFNQFCSRVAGAVVNNLNSDKAALTLVPIPPLAEQHRIVAKIEELLPMVEKYGEAYNKLETLNKSFPAEIKKSILQYAIQGKLTESWRLSVNEELGVRNEEFKKMLPKSKIGGAGERSETEGAAHEVSGESAEELLKHIQAEKAELIKQGKLKKDKNESTIIKRGNSYFEKVGTTEKCIDDELPFEIPDSWRWANIGETCINIQYGSSQKSSCEGKIPVLRMGNLQKGKIIYDKLVYTSDDNEINKYKLCKNDLLFNRTNSKELVGKVSIYKAEMPAIYAGYLVRITPLKINSDYLNYVMQSYYYWQFCQSVRSDAIGQSNINAEKLKKFIFPLPSLAEQHHIVAKIEELFALANTLTNKV